MVKPRIDMYSTLPDGTFTNQWIMDELLGGDSFDDPDYTHVIGDIATKFDESKHPRDKDGKFIEAQGDEGDRPVFYHGTTATSVEGILTHGFQVEKSGQVWPEKSQRDRTYVTADRDDAEEWAKTAVEKRTQQQQLLQRLLGPEAKLPPIGDAIAIFTVRIPDDRLQDLTKDTNFSLDPDAKQFKGSIPPEWIVEAKVGTPSDGPNDFEWKEVPLQKRAAEGQLIYIVVVLQPDAPKPEPKTTGK